MNRFFLEKCKIADKAVMTGEDHRHLSRVLRLAAGDHVMLCDGENVDYLAKITAVGKESTELSIIESHPAGTEPDVRITLFQGLPKAGKLELIIQKCVELGISDIVPVAMERSVVKVSEKEFSSRHERYYRVSYEAAKQSRRGRIPEVHNIVRLAECDLSKYDMLLIAYEDETETTLKQALKALSCTPRTVALFIGPEGGFDLNEIAMLRDKGGVCVSLGRRILRTETAGMAAVAMILYELEGRR